MKQLILCGNRIHLFKSILRLTFVSIMVLPLLSFGQTNLEVVQSNFVIGETLTFDSKILNEKREVNIYLPTYYDLDSIKNYPVIYLLDGSKDEDFIHVAGLVQFATFPWIKMIPESIVVGIANVDRKKDFTYPTSIEKDKKDFPTTGHSEKFIEFIENELQALVEDRYRCNNHRTIIGQSLGGLLSTEILLKRPQLFDHYIIVSPSLWWDDGSLFNLMPQQVPDHKSIFVAVGKEGEIMEGDAKKLYKRLKEYTNPSTQVYFKYLEEQDHGDTLHLALYNAFEAIYNQKDKE